MIIKSLLLTYFKNHRNASFRFGNRINCIFGKNGKGKTNLLDAVYYLSFTKSGVGSQDRLAVTHNAPAFTIYGKYENHTIAVQFERGKTKSFKIDGKEPDRLSDVIGKVPLVMVLPDDTDMIREGSDKRRKFFDGAISQFDQEYLQWLLNYNKLLKQRNVLLKQEGVRINFQLLDTYDDQLIPLAEKISGRRGELKEIFLPFLQKNYKELHEGKEVPELNFKTQITEEFESLFKANIQRDQVMQRTLLGSHRDDFEFLLNGKPIKRFGSQGQQKTFIVALKLALYDFLREQTQKKPLLLLDDIFDKLDNSRIQLLAALLTDRKRFGQIFVTDARQDRCKKLLEDEEDVKFIDIT
ncbi:MAG: DNA replication and repair protein RecF [Ekhidna sp.]|nr:DNA replication and repair protein RecF [Ekhidna sp.]